MSTAKKKRENQILNAFQFEEEVLGPHGGARTSPASGMNRERMVWRGWLVQLEWRVWLIQLEWREWLIQLEMVDNQRNFPSSRNDLHSLH